MEKIANYSSARSPMQVPRRLQAFPLKSSADCGTDFEMYDLDLGGDSSVASGVESGLVKAWESLIASGEYKYMFTLSFVRTYSDSDALDALRHMLRVANRKLLGTRWSAKELVLTGICVAERHEISLELRGALHFHVLIESVSEQCSLLDIVNALREAAMSLKDRLKRPMTATDRIHFRLVDELDVVSRYLTKQATLSCWSIGDNIILLDRGQFRAVPFPMLSKKSLGSLQLDHSYHAGRQ